MKNFTRVIEKLKIAHMGYLFDEKCIFNYINLRYKSVILMLIHKDNNLSEISIPLLNGYTFNITRRNLVNFVFFHQRKYSTIL